MKNALLPSLTKLRYLGVVALALALTVVPISFAQENASASPSVEPSALQASPSGTELLNETSDAPLPPAFELQTLDPNKLKEYASSIETYRAAYREWQIAKEQWQKVETLASLEEAITQSRTVMIARDDVFDIYFQLLDSALKSSGGVELEIKQQLINEIAASSSKIVTHREITKLALDRTAIQTQAQAFLDLQEELDRVGYSTQAYLRIAQLQSLLDQANLITNDIQKYAQQTELNDQTQAAFDRSIEQIRQNLAGIQTKIAQIQATVTKEKNSARAYSAANYNTTKKESSDVYVELRRIPNLLSELFGMIP